MWYWYIRRPNEVFLDLDSKRAVMRAMAVLRWSRCKNVKRVWLFPSESHAHMIIEMIKPLDDGAAALWALWAGSDRLRAVHVIDRIMLNVDAPDVLLSRLQYALRKADDSCLCPKKHDRRIGAQCPVMWKLRANYRESERFALRGRKQGWKRTVQFKWGLIPKKVILQ